jgi:hypothetical protein
MEYPGIIGLLARETKGELQEVIIDPLLAELPDEIVGEYRKQDGKLIFTNGSMIYFRPLDEARKLKGLTLGFFGVDELDAVPMEMWLQLIGQCRQPGVRWAHLATTNPTVREHWIYERWVKDQLPNHEVFTAPTRENKYLPPEFINGLMIGMPDSWIRRYLDGEWGAVSMGERVYVEYSEKIHKYDSLIFNSAKPVFRSWDFGITGSACSFSQFREPAGLDFIGEIFRKNMPSRQFAQLVARYGDELFPEAKYDDVGDIAGHHRDATSGKSPIDEINDELRIRMRTNQVPLATSIDLMKLKLGQNIQGQAALRFHPRCRLSCEGMDGGYVWKRNRDGSVVRGVPAEDGVFEHVMDETRYIVWDQLQFSRTDRKRSIKAPQPKNIWPGVSW